MTGADTPEAWKRIYDRFQPSRSGRELIADARNDLERVYYRHGGRLAHKWHHYLEVYDRFLTVRRGTGVRLLEIGVDQGGSLEIWREYLGPKAVMPWSRCEPGLRVGFVCGSPGPYRRPGRYRIAIQDRRRHRRTST